MRKILTYLILLVTCIPAMAQREALENLLIDAVAHYDAGNFGKADTLLSRLHVADSTNDAVCYYLGMCELQQGRKESGTAFLEEASRLDPSNVWYRHLLAGQLIEQGEYRRAAPMLEKLVSEFPQAYNNPYMLTTAGDAQLSVYKDTLALEYYDRALELEPAYAPAELGRSEIMRMRGNMAGYFVSLTHIIENEEVIPKAKCQILTSLMEKVDSHFWWVWSTQLKDLISKCGAMHPDVIEAHTLQMQIDFIERDTTAVLDECRRIIPLAVQQQNKEKLLESWSIMGDMYHSMGNRKASYSCYEEALKVDPSYAPVLNNYAYYLCTEGKKLKKALKMSEITVRANPDNATYLDTYAWILHLLGRDAEAKPLLKHAMIYGGRESKEVLYHYAEVLRKLGDSLADYYQSLSDQK